MLDADFITIVINLSVLELGPVVTPDLHNISFKFILSPLCKLLEDAGCLVLVIKKESPSVSSKIINNDKTIEITTKTLVSSGTKEVHVK
uniref:Uncharacterized protein n=1 Tax=Arundo donax TaxID=35708 RepID=A0A0A9HP98_ARUDO